jgi:ribosomal protein S18 acetylase RimI-like enzyme
MDRINNFEKENTGLEIVASVSDDLFEKIYAIEREVSTEDMVLSQEDLRNIVDNSHAFTVVIRDGESVSGFVVALPVGEVFDELAPYDSELKNNEGNLYVYDIAISPSKRNLPNFLNLVRKLLSEATLRGYKKLIMHTRKSEGLSGILQKRYGAQKLRTIENWCGYGEPFDYLEMTL